LKIKNTIIILLTVFSFQIVVAQNSSKSADEILKTALQQAKTENKHVFILFEASWCKWCKKMQATINSPVINNYFTSNYIIENITVLESKQNKDLENFGGETLLNKYGGENQGIPYFLIFDKNGKLIADSKMIAGEEILKGKGVNIGCPSTNDEIDAFIFKIQETSNLNYEQLKVIATEFKTIH
jgi:thiol-disulfide isomerase/thioredoxin